VGKKNVIVMYTCKDNLTSLLYSGKIKKKLKKIKKKIKRTYKTETDSKILKPNLWLPKGKHGAGGLN